MHPMACDVGLGLKAIETYEFKECKQAASGTFERSILRAAITRIFGMLAYAPASPFVLSIDTICRSCEHCCEPQRKLAIQPCFTTIC